MASGNSSPGRVPYELFLILCPLARIKFQFLGYSLHQRYIIISKGGRRCTFAPGTNGFLWNTTVRLRSNACAEVVRNVGEQGARLVCHRSIAGVTARTCKWLCLRVGYCLHADYLTNLRRDWSEHRLLCGYKLDIIEGNMVTLRMPFRFSTDAS